MLWFSVLLCMHCYFSSLTLTSSLPFLVATVLLVLLDLNSNYPAWAEPIKLLLSPLWNQRLPAQPLFLHSIWGIMHLHLRVPCGGLYQDELWCTYSNQIILFYLIIFTISLLLCFLLLAGDQKTVVYHKIKRSWWTSRGSQLQSAAMLPWHILLLLHCHI